jgi:predicted ribosomally synthesized peptide with SipW-like signal peptide
MARHRERQPRRTPRSILTATAVMAGAVILGVAGAGGTYAMWNNTTSVNIGTISSGATGLTVNAQTNYSIPTSAMSGMLLPGRSLITSAPLAVKNTGTVGLTVAAGSPVITGPIASDLAVAVRQVASAASTCTPTAIGGTMTTMTAPVTIATGSTIYVCVEAQLATTAPSSVQGQSATFTVPLNGTQVHP